MNGRAIRYIAMCVIRTSVRSLVKPREMSGCRYFGISVCKLIVVPLMNMEIGNRKA
jgi:hypothetical protein